MPYNCKGDLYEREIVNFFRNKGLDVKSVNALNKIMEKMGLLVHYGNGWGTTDLGAMFSMWHKGLLNSMHGILNLSMRMLSFEEQIISEAGLAGPALPCA